MAMRLLDPTVSALSKAQNLADLADKATARDNLGAVSTSGPTQTITGNKIFNALIRANGNIDPFGGVVNINRIDLGLATNGPRIIFENTNNVWFNDCNSVGTIRWATPGNERVTISSVGNMGIGITGGAAANAKLQVAGGVAISSSTAAATDPGAGNLSVSGNANVSGNLSGTRIATLSYTPFPAGNTIDVNAALTVYRGQAGTGAGTPGDASIETASAAAAGTATTQGHSSRIYIKGGTGNVGIATTTPGAKLQVSGGVAIASSTSAATDPGNGNLTVENLITAKELQFNKGVLVSFLHNPNTTDCIFDFNTAPSATGQSNFRFFRNTNSTARNSISILKGDNTLTINTELSGNSFSYINALFGNLAIGSSSAPNAKVQVTGGLVVTSSGSPADPGSGNLSISGNATAATFKRNYTTVIANYTVSATDSVIFINATTASITITLSTAIGNGGRWLRLVRIDNSANTVTVATTASQTINGSTTTTIAGRGTIDVECDNSNYYLA